MLRRSMARLTAILKTRLTGVLSWWLSPHMTSLPTDESYKWKVGNFGPVVILFKGNFSPPFAFFKRLALPEPTS